MATSADPDQLASSETNWSGSTLFAKAGYIQVQQDKGKFWTEKAPNLELWCVSIDWSKTVQFAYTVQPLLKSHSWEGT